MQCAPREGLTDAAELLAQYESGKPVEYQSGYQAQIDSLLGKIQNREPFEYDFNADPLYQQYKDQYLTQGRNAMQDTMGNTAALTGGYGNSYGATAGNQAYQQYVQRLNNVVPTLRDSAYGMYRDQGADMLGEMNLLRGLDSDAYGKHRDEYGNWLNDRNYYSDKYNNQYSREYNEHLNQLGQWNTDRNFDYGKYMDEYGMWAADRDFGYRSAYDGQQQGNWEREYQMAQAAQQQKSSGGSSSGGSGGSKAAKKESEEAYDLTLHEAQNILYQIWKSEGITAAAKEMQEMLASGAAKKEWENDLKYAVSMMGRK